MNTLKSTLIVAAFAGLAAVSSAQYWNMGNDLAPYSVTNDGRSAGYDLSQYFMWSRGGGYVGIGGQVPGNGHGGIPSISSDGTRVGGTSLNTSTGKSEISYFDVATGQWHQLGSLGSFSGDSASASFAMSRNGQHIVGNAWISAGNAQAVDWSGSTLSDLGTLVAGRSTRADGVSNDGSLIGGYQDRADGYRSAAVWHNGTEILLENGGEPLGPVHAVSANGEWAVGGGGYAAGGSAYRWSPNAGLEILDNPFSGWGYEAFATGVSDDGSVIIGVARDPLGWGSLDQGWIWRQGVGTSSMEDYLLEIGVSTGDLLTNPLGVSPDGKTIVGQGVNEAFTNYIGWEVTNPVPEPATMFALGTGLVALVARRRRTRK